MPREELPPALAAWETPAVPGDFLWLRAGSGGSNSWGGFTLPA